MLARMLEPPGPPWRKPKLRNYHDGLIAMMHMVRMRQGWTSLPIAEAAAMNVPGQVRLFQAAGCRQNAHT
eukprot:934148-Alexandrium_andersonii.AAC.1